MSSLQPMTPPALDRVVKRCLAKDPENVGRPQRPGDELKWIAESGSQVTLGTTCHRKGVRSLGRRELILSCRRVAIGCSNCEPCYLESEAHPGAACQPLCDKPAAGPTIGGSGLWSCCGPLT